MEYEFIMVEGSINASLTNVLSSISVIDSYSPMTISDILATLPTCVDYTNQQNDIEETLELFVSLIRKDMQDIAYVMGVINELDTGMSNDLSN